MGGASSATGAEDNDGEDLEKIRSRKDLSDRFIHITQELSTMQTVMQSGFIRPLYPPNRTAILPLRGRDRPAGGVCKEGVPRSRLLDVNANGIIRLKGQREFLTTRLLPRENSIL